MAYHDCLLPNDLETYIDCKGKGLLKCFHVNAQSARNKTLSLEIFFAQFKFSFDVIMITETWYTSDVDVLKLSSYSSYFMNRTTRRGGGVCLLVKEAMKSELLKDYCCVTADYEVLSLRAGNTVISVLYRPPDGRTGDFFQFLERFLLFINENKYDLVLGGDFNIDMLKDNGPRQQMDILINTNGCLNVIKSPTRVTVHSETLIDLFITNFETDKIKAGTLTCNISDHLPIFMCINTRLYNEANSSESFLVQSITPDSLDAFRRDIYETNWDSIFIADDANIAYDSFLNTVKTIYKRHFPYKSIKTSKKKSGSHG